MSFPEPKPGLVIRYAYLWAREKDEGRDESVKDRPAAVLLATQHQRGDLQVLALPITHSRPLDRDSAVEIPVNTRRRLGLDDDQSWIVVSECNVFAWPGPDLRLARGAGAESIVYGFLPERLFEVVRQWFIALHEKAKARFVRRDD